MDDIAKKLGALATALDANFTMNGKPVRAQDVFTPEGLLPMLVKRADQLCSLCVGYGLGVTFEDSDKAVTGRTVKFDEVIPNVLRYLCMADILCELIQTSPTPGVTPLDELMYD